MGDVDDESPTPPSWFSYSVFRDECRRCADRMRQVALVSEKRLDLRDAKRAKRAVEIANELDHLATAFALWDTTAPEQVARERDVLVPSMTILLREALTMLEAMPNAGVLGPVRRR